MAVKKSKSAKQFIYVIASKEPSVLSEDCSRLLDKLIDPAQRTMGLFDVEPDKVSITEIFDELRTLPFLADRRVVVVKNADKFISANRELLERYFENPSSTGVLVLTVSSWDSRTKLAKKLPDVGVLIKAGDIKPWQLPAALVKYAVEKHAKTLSRNAAGMLVELIGPNIAILHNEVDKLAVFIDSAAKITESHIEELTGRNRSFSVFEVIDATTNGDCAGAVMKLRAMFEEDRSSEYTAVGAFAFHFRRMFGAKSLVQQGASKEQVISKMRIWSNKENFFRQLQKMTLNQIGQNIKHLGQIDYELKTGQTTAKTAMEQLILGLCRK